MVSMRQLVFALAAAALVGPACAPASPVAASAASSPRTLADELLAADRGFSGESSREEGLSAFGRMFADDVVMYAIPVPGFARGRSQALEVLGRSLGGSSHRTEWTPIRVGISADGQHGFTFGYMVTRADGQAPAHSKYMSYWVRTADGWRVRLYKRVPRPEGAVSSAMMAPALPARLLSPNPDAGALEVLRRGLDRRERDFSDEAQRIGLGPAFARFGSADAVNVGGGPEFILGNEAIGQSQPSGPSPLVWAPDGVIVASSGDLGVTWGMLRRTGPTPLGRLATIPWFTIWHRASPGAPWLYVAE